ncbi:MAG: hypothetical protein H7319_02600 [Spirosoma sp.]|nr:hypothetical protein [Spirosoma sp.]
MLIIAIYIALALLLILQIGWLVRNKTLSPGRKTVRAGLNTLLFMLIAAYVWQPTWTIDRPAKHVLLVGDDVPNTLARRVQDSLGLAKRVTASNFKPRYDSVTLLGQDFPRETLAKLSRATVNWIPYDAPGQARDLHYKAIVRQGEVQQITGRINSAEKQKLAVRYGNRTLDSTLLSEGENAFTLQFPAFAQGRTRAELMLGETVLDTLHFFGTSLRPLKIQFLLSNPDFESKTLADWLGRHGHTVQLTTGISKNVSRELRINADKAIVNPDLLITEPDNAGSAAVRNVVRAGRAVLFINLTNAETDVRTIGRATGSGWPVRRVASTATMPLNSNLTALPYRFADAPNQILVATYPIAVQRVAMTNAVGRVGVSLLSETFPLALSGDSLAYGGIWSAVLARLYPAADNNLRADAPLLSGFRNDIQLNNATSRPSALITGTDTVALASSPINLRTERGVYQPGQPGWQPVADTLALYVSDAQTEPAARRIHAGRETVRQFMLAHARYESAGTGTEQTSQETVPNWLWLTLFLVVLTALWVEPKL